MIRNNALANRLNAVKGGQEIPKSVNDDNILRGINLPVETKIENPVIEVNQISSIKTILLSSLISFAEIFILSFFYGFGARTLMSQDWNVLGIFGVGLIVNQIFSLISNLKLFR